MERFIWSVVIFVLFSCGVFYLLRARKMTTSNEKIINFGFGCIYISLAFARMFFYFGDYFVSGNYSGHNYYGSFNNISPTLELMLLLGSLSWIFGFTAILFAIERVVKRTKYAITSFNIIIIIIMLIIPFKITWKYLYIIQIVEITLIIIVLTWVSRRSTQESQTMSSFLIIGGIFIFFGFILHSTAVRQLNIISYLIPVILILLGCAISVSPAILNIKVFTHSLFIWSFLIGVNLSLLFLGFYLLFFYQIPYFYKIAMFGISIINIFIMIYAVVQLKKIIHPKLTRRKIASKREDVRDLLKIFTRPKTLTEAEIAFYREQKVCLVCKGEVIGFNNFICPSCNVLYCAKCAIALSELENICWVCETTIDKTKPIKLLEKKDKKIREKKDIHKKFTN